MSLLIGVHKMKLDFLTIIDMNKDYMDQNFDLITHTELQQFGDQREIHFMLEQEYVNDMDRLSATCKERGFTLNINNM